MTAAKLTVHDARRVPAAHCPLCGALCDAATGVGEKAVPVPGDLSVCLYCSGFLQYGPGLELVELTAAEMHALPADLQERLWLHRRIIQQAPARLRRMK